MTNRKCFVKGYFFHIVLSLSLYIYLFLSYVISGTNIEILSIIRRFMKMDHKAAEAILNIQ